MTTTPTFPPCQFDGDPACGPVFVPVDNPPDPTVIDAAQPAPVVLPVIPGVEMCLPSGSALLALFPCDPACGYITFRHGAVVCHGSTPPHAAVATSGHSLPSTGYASGPISGLALLFVVVGTLLHRKARRATA